MTDGLLPSALREVRSELTRRPVIVGLLAVGIILGISGPFDTFRILSPFPRVAYWVSIVCVTFIAGSLTATVVHKLLAGRSTWLTLGLSTCAVGLVVTCVLELFNLLAFGLLHDTWAGLARQLGIVTLISGVIEAGHMALRTAPEGEQAGEAPLLKRLPLDKRGALIAISAEDHYVRVTTGKGSELVLMRLSDAMNEVGDTDGLQIHRSHWVATDQITQATRNGDRGEVTLSDGSVRPVSRGYMPHVRAAGLLAQGVRRKGR